MKTLHWTSRDLELLPDDGNRYEIIDGELYVSKQPDWQHQLVCFQLGFLLETWNEQSQAGKHKIFRSTAEKIQCSRSKKHSRETIH